jgi:prepilin-type N-terminal cleavage/methylation domain-containing protein
MLVKMKRQGGFTLVELMVCIAIIGILSAIAIPNDIRYRERSKVARAQAELNSLQTVINMLALDSNCYPSGDPVADFEDGGSEFYLDDDSDLGLIGATGDFLDCMNATGGY